MNTNVLAIDDNEQFCISLSRMLEGDELKVIFSLNSANAFSILEKENIQVILLDVRLGDESGLDVLMRLVVDFPSIPVIMLTGIASIESAVQSIKLGAFDYIQKPVKFEKLTKLINDARTMTALGLEKKNLYEKLEDAKPKILSEDPQINEILRIITKVTKANLPILLYGENGTGKELFADYIHAQSNRRTRKMVKINCASFPESLLDNELFGHEKGAYTGANSVYKGVFERADKGTLFLDEIGDMSLDVQAKVLRVLQNKELFRLGGKDVIHLDVRIISATNKKLEDLIKKGIFREDLYYRLNAASFSIPPLRERMRDLQLLVDYLLREHASVNGKPITTISSGVQTLFKEYYWPGNIRELQNVLNYAAAVTNSGVIEEKNLPSQFVAKLEPKKIFPNLLDDSEKDIILKELIRTKYNKKKVAESLNISRTTLYSKMKRYGIE